MVRLTAAWATVSCVMMLGATPLSAQGSKLPARSFIPPWGACEQERLSGHVRSVTVWSGDVQHGTSQSANGRRVESTVEFSDDGRRATETVSHGFNQSIRTYEFDAAGKLITYRSGDGDTLFEAMSCRYDSLGRLTASISERPGSEGEILYTYGDGRMTVRIVPSLAPTVVLTYQFDETGRPVRAIERDERTGAQRSGSRYEYKDGGRVTCDLTPAERCTFARIDDHDHVIEETFPDGRRRRESFDYDRSGNWVTHVSDHGSSRDQAVWRDITYK
jgi:hypothetical protein